MKRSDIKHLAILEAAQAEFLTQGYEGASTDGICQRAGVSKRTLYRHFNNKQGLFKAVLARLHQLTRYKIHTTYDVSLPLKPQLIGLLASEVKIHDETYSLPTLRMIVVELLRQPEMTRQLLDEVYAQESSFSHWLELAAAAGAVDRERIPLMTRMLKGMFSGMIIWPSLLAGQESASQHLDPTVLAEIAELFCQTYGIQSA